MSNFFLLNEAIPTQNYEIFKEGFKELVLIEKEDDDVFLRHDSLWQMEILEQLYINYTLQEETVMCKFIEQLSPSDNYFDNSIQIDNHYQGEDNGFLGVNFTHLTIEPSKQIKNNPDYVTFNYSNLWNVNFRNFWQKKEKLFPNLIMCGDVESQISQIGNSGYFNQIIDRLKSFNEAVENWQVGNFSYHDINRNFPLRISPESSQTMDRYGNQRLCQLPDGGTDSFQLHIKTGDLRFHFLPNNTTKKVYIGYIGPHLQTISN